MEENKIYGDKITEALKSCYDYFCRLVPGIGKIISGINETPDRYLKDLSDACEGINWLSRAFLNTSEAHGIEVNADRVRKNLDAIAMGLENKDFNYISETLEYEILPMLVEWFEKLDQDYGYDGEE